MSTFADISTGDPRGRMFAADIEALVMRHTKAGLTPNDFVAIMGSCLGYSLGNGAPTAGDMERGINLATRIVDETAREVFRTKRAH